MIERSIPTKNIGSILPEFVGALKDIHWDDHAVAHNRAEELLRALWQRGPYLFQALYGRISQQPIHSVTRQGELHSWCLYQGNTWTLKLNQFEPDPMSGRRSLCIHNHTRPLTTLTLAGGYDSSSYFPIKPPEDYNEGEAFENLREVPVEPTHPGYVHTIGKDDIHGLTDFKDGTLTLAVYGAFARSEITLFNTITGKVERRKRYEVAHKEMLERLSKLAN